METNAKGHAGMMAGGACDRRLCAAVQQELTWFSAWPSWVNSDLPAGKPRPSKQGKSVSARDQQGEKILLVLKYTPVSSSLMDSVLHYTIHNVSGVKTGMLMVQVALISGHWGAL